MRALRCTLALFLAAPALSSQALDSPSIAATAAQTEYVTFMSGQLRIIAHEPDTLVLIHSILDGTPLDPQDFIQWVGFLNGGQSNPFYLAGQGSTFVARNSHLIGQEKLLRIRTADANCPPGTPGCTPEPKPITVWTGGRLRGNVGANRSWASYVPVKLDADESFGREVGRTFIGYTQREVLIIGKKEPGIEPNVTLERFGAGAGISLFHDNLAPTANVNGIPIPISSSIVYQDDEVIVYYTNFHRPIEPGYADVIIPFRVDADIDVTVLAGYEIFRDRRIADPQHNQGAANYDWAVSVSAFDTGIELGKEFYVFASADLTIFPTEDGTLVDIVDLSDGDDTILGLPLLNGTETGSIYDIYGSRTHTNQRVRTQNPQVNLHTNGASGPFENDVLKITSNKPILVNVGPLYSNFNEYADVAYSIPKGPERRLTYLYVQNGGGSNDLQIYSLTRQGSAPNTVSITSLTRTINLQSGTHHDGHIDFGVPPGQPPIVTPPIGVAEPTLGEVQRFGSGIWSGELLRIESDRPVLIFGSDYDDPNWGTFVPYMSFSHLFPPVAELTGPDAVCAGQAATFVGGGFDQDSDGFAPTGLTRFDWDFGDGTNLQDGGPHPTPHVYTTPGTYEVTLTVTDDDGDDAQTDSTTLTIVVDADVEEYGSGAAGCGHPEPLLGSDDCAISGQPMTIAVTQGEGGAFGYIVFSDTGNNVPFLSGTLWIGPAMAYHPHFLTGTPGDAGAGAYSRTYVAPPALAGMTLFAQSFYVTSCGEQAVSMTNGMSIDIH